MKYIKLSFRNAGFFKTNKNTKDFFFDVNGKKKRKDVMLNKQQKVSISVNQISGMLHVLMGERPNATYRETLIECVQPIFQIANNSMIKISTPLYSKKDNTGKYYQSETITVRKAVGNSWSKSPDLVYWKRIENLLTDNDDNSLYLELINIATNLLKKDVTIMRAKDVVLELNENFNNEQTYCNYRENLKNIGKTPLYNFLIGKYDGTFNSNERTSITINFGVDQIIRLSGNIIIPIDEWGLNKIQQSKGCATLLDGGFVFIEEIVDGMYIGEDYFKGYININELEQHENNN